MTLSKREFVQVLSAAGAALRPHRIAQLTQGLLPVRQVRRERQQALVGRQRRFQVAAAQVDLRHA